MSSFVKLERSRLGASLLIRLYSAPPAMNFSRKSPRSPTAAGTLPVKKYSAARTGTAIAPTINPTTNFPIFAPSRLKRNPRSHSTGRTARHHLFRSGSHEINLRLAVATQYGKNDAARKPCTCFQGEVFTAGAKNGIFSQ